MSLDPKTAHLTRQLELVPLEILNTSITIGGAGAIGGNVAMVMAKMGFEKIHSIDFDQVSVENLNSQPYRFTDLGRDKVDCLQEIIEQFTGLTIVADAERYVGIEAYPGVVICAFDSMEARKTIWKRHKENFPTKLFVDARMGAETAQLYAMNPCDTRDIEGYEKSLYSDSEAVHERCTAKATMYCALMLSGLVAMTVTKFLAGERYARTAQWSVKDNSLIAFDQHGKRFGG